ncbi:hypothetical protein [Ktedonobacter racemifer]|uniref:Uncharacterized protein n=1 Tax=Ktedonobacter racemifer DSM 44963 TaxID=485913 RepID=D6TP72_KTERA|nr:hypothetical protein [Ktedonobacter racemifer]EFH87428.1 hypothetical protein Krac_8760 [Ktedonobacter racemifer DSM 44963]
MQKDEIPPARIWWSPEKGVQGDEVLPAGVWGVPRTPLFNLFFAAAGGKKQNHTTQRKEKTNEEEDWGGDVGPGEPPTVARSHVAPTAL